MKKFLLLSVFVSTLTGCSAQDYGALATVGLGFLLGGPVGAAATAQAMGEREKYNQAVAAGPQAVEAYYRQKREQEERERLEEIERRLRQQELERWELEQKIHNLQDQLNR